jgi:dTDP-4-amino-4,6-dideoxygalactose transaminase
MHKKVIPAFSLERQVKNMRRNFVHALEKVIDCQQFIGGTFIEQFEKQLAQYLQVKHVISCNSGTDALWMALHAMNMPENAIVLTTPFSFIASSSEIASNNAHPVFIDIEPDTFNINPQLITQWLTKHATIKDGKTIHRHTGFPIVGIIPVDIFGQCANYTEIQQIAELWNLWIIEDCAQALGAELKGQQAATFGNIGALSFYPTKNLGAFGDAGCCVTNDDALAEKLLEIRHHGRKANYEYQSLGINSRLDAFQAVILSQKLPHLDDWNHRRRDIAERYKDGLAHVSVVQCPQEKVGTHVFHQYTVTVTDSNGNSLRDQMSKYLQERGVQTRVFYPQSLQDISFLRTHQALTTMCPIAQKAAANVLSLPMWPELEDSEIEYVITCIKDFVRDTQEKQPAQKTTKEKSKQA